MGKDYYQTLALTRSATNADVKKAYRKLSLKHHPDRSEDPKSEDLFIEVRSETVSFQAPFFSMLALLTPCFLLFLNT